MAKYNFKCSRCDAVEIMMMSITEFLSLKNKGFFENKECNDCKEKTSFVRIFSAASSEVSKSKDEIMAKVKEDARKIVEKVRLGDTGAILNIYGEDI